MIDRKQIEEGRFSIRELIGFVSRTLSLMDWDIEHFPNSQNDYDEVHNNLWTLQINAHWIESVKNNAINELLDMSDNSIRRFYLSRWIYDNRSSKVYYSHILSMWASLKEDVVRSDDNFQNVIHFFDNVNSVYSAISTHFGFEISFDNSLLSFEKDDGKLDTIEVKNLPLSWSGNKNEIYELIQALYLTSKIVNSDTGVPIQKKELIKVFESLFKDNYQELDNGLRESYKRYNHTLKIDKIESLFLSYLKKLLINDKVKRQKND